MEFLNKYCFQIINDREILKKTGKIVQGFAYMFGLNELKWMIDCIEKYGIRYGRTTISTHDFNILSDYLCWNPTCHILYLKFN